MRIKHLILLSFILCFSCTKEEDKPSLPFKNISPQQSGIHFTNQVDDTPDFNILEYLYFYNGGGVATGDLNNDGLPDVFFTANKDDDHLYINKGNFKFELANQLLPQADLGGWSTGVTLVDINSDGWLDIYVCKLGAYKGFQDHNKLFVNQKGQGFVESAKEYGLDFVGFSTQSAFFDYDRDGDLDCYLLNHSVKSPEQFKPSEIRNRTDSLAGDRLFENVDGQYLDVTETAGIYSSSVSFGLGIDVADLNEDGWPDIYIANDFHENDYLYLNQKDKTFKEVISQSTGHTSNFSMGCAIADINNDLAPDIFSLDMKPYDEKVYKKSGGWESIEIYNFKRRYGYHHQSPRNALQINVGFENDVPMYSERAAYYGLEATDWSWSPLIYDFDNDGDKDIYVSNGIARRPNDMDFVNFYFKANADNLLEQIEKMPTGNVPNFYFENDIANHSFSKTPSTRNTLSNGAAVADFDLDGRLDIAINNLNEPASILENSSARNHFVSIRLKGDSKNPFGLGARIILHSQDKKQEATLKSSTGFQSFSEPVVHFGLQQDKVDSIQIIWPDGNVQTEINTAIDQRIEIEKRATDTALQKNKNTQAVRPIHSIADYQHRENKLNEQQANKWLLYNQSTFGPRIEKLDEQYFYLSGNQLSPSGKIDVENDRFIPFTEKQLDGDEQGACLLNFQGESHLYVTQSGNQYKNGDTRLADVLYNWSNSEQPVALDAAFPLSKLNTAVCKSNDYDKDGDEDIFVGVHSSPGQYGGPLTHYLLINQGDRFEKKELDLDGMVYDATWADMDGNGYDDLVVVGHWMNIWVLYNDSKQFSYHAIPGSSGLWNCVYVSDINNNGMLDVVAGNYGKNHSLDASSQHPMQYYFNDFDRNGQQEALVTYYADGREVPYPSQSSLTAQIPATKKKFLKNEPYSNARIDEIFTPDLLEESHRGKVEELASSCFFQTEDKNWTKENLPPTLQMAPIYAIEKSADDVFFFGGNFYEVDPNWGRQDAGQLSAFSYSNQQWDDQAGQLQLPIVKGAIRDLLIQNKKLYIAINNEGLRVIDLDGKR